MPQQTPHNTRYGEPHVWTAPGGFGPWEPVGMREFERANRDGLPTQMIELRNDDQYLVQYYVARHMPRRSTAGAAS